MPIIQPYSSQYQEQVIQLISHIQQQEFGIPISVEQQPDLLTIPTFYQSGNGNFWIALDRDLVVGTIALVDIGDQQAAIRKMFVHKDYRGKSIGVAQQLLNTLLEWSSRRAINDLYLGTVEILKAARRFYEKNGFVTIPETDLPPTFPRMAVDTQFYKYRLSDA